MYLFHDMRVHNDSDEDGNKKKNTIQAILLRMHETVHRIATPKTILTSKFMC